MDNLYCPYPYNIRKALNYEINMFLIIYFETDIFVHWCTVYITLIIYFIIQNI
jgi:hypothetical protein